MWEKVHRSGDTDCWIWTGATNTAGYGVIGVKRDDKYRMAMAHRVVYVLSGGEIPEGLQLDHLCRVRFCVRPSHLEPVTCKENLRRGDGITGRSYRATACKWGHDYTEANTYVNAQGYRSCRICHARRERERKARRK